MSVPIMIASVRSISIAVVGFDRVCQVIADVTSPRPASVSGGDDVTSIRRTEDFNFDV